jgi:radical SAM superfamily enzyme YgiQ (UPF0313 family)
VTKVAHGRQKSEAPERTAAVLTHLQREYAIDAVQFYDNNFFLREADAAELAARIAPLTLKWWCEGRIDALLRYSDDTMHALRRAGCEMIFLGAESGSDKLLARWTSSLRRIRSWRSPIVFASSGSFRNSLRDRKSQGT